MNKSEDNYERNNYKFSALENNISSINSIVSSVEGTIGPKGLDCMIVDDNGNSVITNDGITILSEIAVTHPASRLLINAVMAQQREIGDGTTTMTIVVGGILSKALEYARMGVPIHTIINGIKIGIDNVIEILDNNKILINEENYDLLKRIAFLSARENKWISDLIYESIEIIGLEEFKNQRFRFMECIETIEDVKCEAFDGIIIDQYPKYLFKEKEMTNVKVMTLDDSIDIDKFNKELLNTERGFERYLESLEELKSWGQKIVKLNIDIFLCSRVINPEVEQILLDGGVNVISNVLSSHLNRAARYCGSQVITKQALKKDLMELEKYCGFTKKVIFDDDKEITRIQCGEGSPQVSIVISGSTPEVIKERGRIAMDSASAVQISINKGIVPGGGASELYCIHKLEELKKRTHHMDKYGLDCVIEGIKRPFLQMVENAGYNSLEKYEKIIDEIETSKSKFLSIDFNTGDLVDITEEKIYDPLEVKVSALKKALEIIESILRINLILKGRNP